MCTSKPPKNVWLSDAYVRGRERERERGGSVAGACEGGCVSVTHLCAGSPVGTRWGWSGARTLWTPCPHRASWSSTRLRCPPGASSPPGGRLCLWGQVAGLGVGGWGVGGLLSAPFILLVFKLSLCELPIDTHCY